MSASQGTRGWLAGARALVLVFAGGAGCIEPPPTTSPAAEQAEDQPAAEPLWEATGPGALYEPGEVRAFVLTQGGHALGTSWGRYVGPVEDAPKHHRFETKIELQLPGREPIRSEGVLVLDASGHLVRGQEHSNAAAIVFRRSGEAIELQSGGAEDVVAYEPDERDTAVWADSAIFHEELMFGLRTVAPGEMSWRVVPLSGGVPMEWTGTVQRRGGPSSSYAEVRTNLGEVLVLQDRRIVSIDVAADELHVEAVQSPPPWPSWSVTPPAPVAYEPPADGGFAIREVEIPGKPEAPRLVGEVLIPDVEGEPSSASTPSKAGATGETHPGVLFLSGAGLQDRHGITESPPTDLGSHHITDALAQAGCVVLRYDEPGFGDSESAPLSFAHQVRDARRALATLLVQEEVDPDRVVIVGHGEGGWRALMLAARDPAIAGVALLGTPGRPYREVLADQAEVSFERLPPELREDAREAHRRMLAVIEAGGQPPTGAVPEVQWLREIFKLDPAELIAEVDVPLWLAQGSKDFEVDPDRDLQGLVAAAEAHGKRHTVARYPGLDHLFKPEPEVSRPARYRIPDRPVDPGFLADLVAWVRRITQP